jgi:hypothetical protein
VQWLYPKRRSFIKNTPCHSHDFGSGRETFNYSGKPLGRIYSISIGLNNNLSPRDPEPGLPGVNYPSARTGDNPDSEVVRNPRRIVIGAIINHYDFILAGIVLLLQRFQAARKVFLFVMSGDNNSKHLINRSNYLTNENFLLNY